MISLSQHCLPKDPEKINQCFAVFAVSILHITMGVCLYGYARHTVCGCFSGVPSLFFHGSRAVMKTMTRKN